MIEDHYGTMKIGCMRQERSYASSSTMNDDDDDDDIFLMWVMYPRCGIRFQNHYMYVTPFQCLQVVHGTIYKFNISLSSCEMHICIWFLVDYLSIHIRKLMVTSGDIDFSVEEKSSMARDRKPWITRINVTISQLYTWSIYFLQFSILYLYIFLFLFNNPPWFLYLFFTNILHTIYLSNSPSICHLYLHENFHVIFIKAGDEHHAQTRLYNMYIYKHTCVHIASGDLCMIRFSNQIRHLSHNIYQWLYLLTTTIYLSKSGYTFE